MAAISTIWSSEILEPVSISQARFLKWPPGWHGYSFEARRLFQSLRRDSSSGRYILDLKATNELSFQSLRRDSSSGRCIPNFCDVYASYVSISQARFLKWPHDDIVHLEELLGYVSISQARFLKWPRLIVTRSLVINVSFNLSGEIPQVAAV